MRTHASSFPSAWGAAEFEQLLGAGETVAHGAIEPSGGRLAGFVLSRTAADEAEVVTLAVRPERRRRGIARRLLAAHSESLATCGVRRLFLEVASDNVGARELYTGFGFVQVGERKGYYRAGRAIPEPGLVLRLDLARER